MDADSVITQFVDGDGNEVSDGETGEIVHTSLFNFAMPFIKYSAGDMGRASKDECACGRVLPLMEIGGGQERILLWSCLVGESCRLELLQLLWACLTTMIVLTSFGWYKKRQAFSKYIFK